MLDEFIRGKDVYTKWRYAKNSKNKNNKKKVTCVEFYYLKCNSLCSCL
jgi:hypothetical protein